MTDSESARTNGTVTGSAMTASWDMAALKRSFRPVLKAMELDDDTVRRVVNQATARCVKEARDGMKRREVAGGGTEDVPMRTPVGVVAPDATATVDDLTAVIVPDVTGKACKCIVRTVGNPDRWIQVVGTGSGCRVDYRFMWVPRHCEAVAERARTVRTAASRALLPRWDSDAVESVRPTLEAMGFDPGRIRDVVNAATRQCASENGVVLTPKTATTEGSLSVATWVDVGDDALKCTVRSADKPDLWVEFVSVRTGLWLEYMYMWASEIHEDKAVAQDPAPTRAGPRLARDGLRSRSRRSGCRVAATVLAVLALAVGLALLGILGMAVASPGWIGGGGALLAEGFGVPLLAAGGGGTVTLIAKARRRPPRPQRAE